MATKSVVTALSFLLALLVVGCEQQPTAQSTPLATPVNDPARLDRGQALFGANCARCHGARGEGAPNWHKPNAQGKYPAPPLDASGHAWHHPRADLRAMIKHGTVARGGDMPAWDSKLSDDEIDAIIAWFQSTWPQEIFTAWQELDAQATGARP